MKRTEPLPGFICQSKTFAPVFKWLNYKEQMASPIHCCHFLKYSSVTCLVTRCSANVADWWWIWEKRVCKLPPVILWATLKLPASQVMFWNHLDTHRLCFQTGLIEKKRNISCVLVQRICPGDFRQATQTLFGVSQNNFGETVNMKLYLKEHNKRIYRTHLLKASRNYDLKKMNLLCVALGLCGFTH